MTQQYSRILFSISEQQKLKFDVCPETHCFLPKIMPA